VSDSEWYGEPHTLIVHAVTPPSGPFDDGGLDYDIEHPPSCKQEERGSGGHTCAAWTCDVAQQESDGLPFSLRYSGTPITEPGTYRIQGWGRKTYCHEYGAYEYDAGVGVMDPEEPAGSREIPELSGGASGGE
jgi:hypothetical protein